MKWSGSSATRFHLCIDDSDWSGLSNQPSKTVRKLDLTWCKRLQVQKSAELVLTAAKPNAGVPAGTYWSPGKSYPRGGVPVSRWKKGKYCGLISDDQREPCDTGPHRVSLVLLAPSRTGMKYWKDGPGVRDPSWWRYFIIYHHRNWSSTGGYKGLWSPNAGCNVRLSCDPISCRHMSLSMMPSLNRDSSQSNTKSTASSFDFMNLFIKH